jgi:16S rRNA processing protein RimM
MSNDSRRILLGRITGVHGVRGDVVIDSYTAEPTDIGAYGPLESEDGTRSFEIKVVRVTPKGAVIARVAGIGDRTEAEKLKATPLYADRARLPPTEEGQYYHADLVGLRVEDAQGRVLGSVIGVANYGAGDLLDVRLEGEKGSELIPFTDAFVPVVDVTGGRVVVNLPETSDDEDEPEPDEAAAEKGEEGA